MNIEDLLTGEPDCPMFEYGGAVFSRGQMAVGADAVLGLLDAAGVPADAAEG